MLGLYSPASLVDAACWICSICVQHFVHVGVGGYSRHTACIISVFCCQQCILFGTFDPAMPVPFVIKSARAGVCNTLCHHQYGAQQACALMLKLCRAGLVYAACVVCSICACGVLFSSHYGYPPCIGCVIPVAAVLCLEPLNQLCMFRMAWRIVKRGVFDNISSHLQCGAHKACSGYGLTQSLQWMRPGGVDVANNSSAVWPV